MSEAWKAYYKTKNRNQLFLRIFTPTVVAWCWAGGWGITWLFIGVALAKVLR